MTTTSIGGPLAIHLNVIKMNGALFLKTNKGRKETINGCTTASLAAPTPFPNYNSIKSIYSLSHYNFS